MDDNIREVSIEGRRAERVDLDGNVKIRFTVECVEGSGQNVSAEGVFFVSQGRVPVEVVVEGSNGPVTGQLVRIENLGDGNVGIAVKFDEAHPELVDG